jgi:hypothetical protein
MVMWTGRSPTFEVKVGYSVLTVKLLPAPAGAKTTRFALSRLWSNGSRITGAWVCVGAAVVAGCTQGRRAYVLLPEIYVAKHASAFRYRRWSGFE